MSPFPILFLDTETTGFPQKNRALDAPEQPYLVQFAWIMFDGHAVTEEGQFVVANGVTIPEQAAAVHGITTARAEAVGVDRYSAASRISARLHNAGSIVGHNIDFDMQILRIHLARHGLTMPDRPTFCTMRAATDRCKIPGARGGYKWPKLQEAHQILCGEAFDGAHDALNDVRATFRVWQALCATKVENN